MLTNTKIQLCQSFIRKHWPKKKLPIDGQEKNKCANENPVLEELEMHQRISRIKNEVRKILECCVCLEYMKRPGPRYIYGCTNDHYICSKCLKSPTIKSCPQCRECFRKHSPKRRYQSEAMQELFQKLFEISLKTQRPLNAFSEKKKVQPKQLSTEEHVTQSKKLSIFSWLPRGGSSAIYGREAGVALTGMKKQRRDRGW